MFTKTRVSGEEDATKLKEHRSNRTYNLIISVTSLAAYGCAGLFIWSGAAKFINANDSVDTVKLISRDFLGLDLPFLITTLVIYLLIAWEVALGILFIIGNRRRIVLWAFAFTNLVFLVVSHYLNYLDRLESCGCMGGVNQVFSALHFPVLYVFSGAFLILLFFGKSAKTHDLKKDAIKRKAPIALKD